LGFFWFPFGIFTWILPVLFVALGVKLLRYLFHNFSRRFDDDYYRTDYYLDRNNRELEDVYSVFSTKKEREVESQIFKLAYKRRGRITLSDIVIETGLSMKEAESIIEKMIDGMRVRMEVGDDGIIYYEFPEIIARFEEDGKA